MSDSSENSNTSASGMDRRDFLRIAGVGAGALIVGACADEPDRIVRGIVPRKKNWGGSGAGHVVVVGAGAWGSWTALNLRRRGARVTLIDAYGAGNSRASSGDETRGIRSSYGDRAAGTLWTEWARESIVRWSAFDEEYAREFHTKFFHRTGDLILRTAEEPFTTKTLEHWKSLGVPHEQLSVDEVHKRWPVINADDITVVLYEPDAGVVRARASTQAVADIAEREGVQRIVARVKPGPIANGNMDGVVLDDGTVVRGDAYVFACGPWLRKVFPELLTNRMRVPLGVVCYYAVPEGDTRFSYPNLPSWNFPGVTGWATLPVDSRGFRARGSLGRSSGQSGGQTASANAGANTNANAASNTTRQGNAPTPRVQASTERPATPPAPPDPTLQDPDLSSRWATPERMEGSRRFIERRFPLLATAPVNETRACHYDSSINRDFIIDNVPNTSNAWIAGAGQAEGFKFSIVVGEYIAQRVLGERGDDEIAKAFSFPEDEYEAT